MQSFWKNIYNQIHSFWQAIGIFLVGAIATYIVNTASNQWSWQGIAVSLASAVLTYGLTKNDHNKTAQAVEKAAVTGEVPGKEQS
jgi:membrane protein implicated in regulation of membrane protease activity